MLRGPADPDKFRIKVGRYSERWYHDPLPTCPIAEASDESWPAMTTVLNAWPKFLTDWAARQSAEWAYDNRKAWAELDRDEAVPLIAGAHKRERDRAADRGTQVHSIFEAVAAGEHLDPQLYPEAQDFLPAVHQVLDDLQPTWLLSEVVVFDRTVGFGGTLDTAWRTAAFGDMAIDFKSRKDHSVYNDKATQIAGYAGAEYAIVEHDGQARRIKLPTFDQAVLITITPDDYRIHPVNLELGAEAIVAVKRFWTAQGGRLVGKPLHVERAQEVAGEVVAAATPTAPSEPVASAGGGLPPSPATTDRRAWIIGRVTAIAEAGYLDTLGAIWPEGVPTFRQTETHSDEQIDVIAAACSRVEQAKGLPFPEPDPAAEAAMVRVTEDDPRVVELHTRIAALPDDLGQVVMAVPARPTEAQLAECTAAVAEAEEAQAARLDQVRHLLVDLPDADAQAVVLETVVGEQSQWLRLSADHVALISLVVEAWATGYLAIADHHLGATEGCEQLLLTLHGDRTKARSAARHAAKSFAIDVPGSFADVMANPLLIALCMGAPEPAAPAAA